MYEEYYNFTGAPFPLTPDTKFFFGARSHNKAMAYLHYGLRQRDGFIVITGEQGIGKTMLTGHLLDQIDDADVRAARLQTPTLTPDDLLGGILKAFELTPNKTGKAAEIEAFEDFLFDQMNRGVRVLLIVDEAQNLPTASLEELRVLSNIDYEGTPLFQVFLVGRPSLKDAVAKEGSEAFHQRVIASYEVERFSQLETRAYIEHRLSLVGWQDQPVVTDRAFDAIHEATGGNPLKVNTLFGRVLLLASIEERREIDDETIRKVIADLDANDGFDAPSSMNSVVSFDDVIEAAGAEETPTNTDDDPALVPSDPVEIPPENDPKTDGHEKRISGELETTETVPQTGDDGEASIPQNEPDMTHVDKKADQPVTETEGEEVGESVLDRLKARKKAGSRKTSTTATLAATGAPSSDNAAPVSASSALAPADGGPATIADVADAIEAARKQDDEQQETERFEGDASRMSESNDEQSTGPKFAHEKGDLEKDQEEETSEVPYFDDDPKGWKRALVESVKETRADLSDAQSLAK